MGRKRLPGLRFHKGVSQHYVLDRRDEPRYFGSDAESAKRRHAGWVLSRTGSLLGSGLSDEPSGLAHMSIQPGWEPPPGCKVEYDELLALLDELRSPGVEQNPSVGRFPSFHARVHTRLDQADWAAGPITMTRFTARRARQQAAGRETLSAPTARGPHGS